MTGFAGISWLVGGKLVQPARRLVPAPPNLACEDVHIHSESGSRLSGWHLEATDATSTIVLLHPIRGDRRSMLSRAALLHANGYSVLMIDFQAHGESPGQAITFGHLESRDVEAAVSYVRSRNPQHTIGVVGRSLGGAAALLAKQKHYDALVLESVYPAIHRAVANRVGMRMGSLRHFIVPTLLMQLKPRLGVSARELRPIDHMATVGCPVLVACGDRDVHTTREESQSLFDAAVEPKEFVLFEGAPHMDLFGYDPNTYIASVVPFLDRHLQ